MIANPTSLLAALLLFLGIVIDARADGQGPRPIVISGVEDTIMSTPWQAAPGMSDLYRRWQRRTGAEFVYLSGMASWNERRLAAWLDSEGFPAGRILLRSSADYLTSEKTFKISLGIDILETAPGVPVTVVGGVRGSDPEVFGEMARTYPQIRRILIRDPLPNAHAERFDKAFYRLSYGQWAAFSDPADINGMRP